MSGSTGGKTGGQGGNVQMAVEMDDGHWTISPVDTPQQWEGYGVVSAKGDDAG